MYAAHGRCRRTEGTRVSTLKRKVGLGLSALALSGALVLSGGMLAQADPDTVDGAKAQLEQLEQQASEIDMQYAAAQEQKAKSEKELSQIQSDSAAQSDKVAALRAQVAQVALQQYRSRSMDTTTQLLVTEDVESFLNQLSTVQKVNDNTNALLQDYQSAQANLADMSRSAQAKSDAISADAQQLADLKKQSDAKVKAAEDLLAKLTADQKRKLEEQRQADAAARLAAGQTTTTSRSVTETVTPVVSGTASSRAQGALSFALAQVGKAYSMGATGPSAYDCSGLTSAAYRSVGVSLPRTSQAQFGVGTPVGLSQLQPGDLVFYYSGISHVGMYIGNGMIVHAANPRSGVTTAPVTSMPFMGGRRVA